MFWVEREKKHLPDTGRWRTRKVGDILLGVETVVVVSNKTK